ncbi:MAG: hypothetical protein OZSIB_2689 [Candidatus Ozemobacter sibiricus]|jgi:hypothetical protein|uniref:Uncharacterized protein n=1 Tax=Candidatus Ozemobacter sibiricus TaxID=2268124 RepID=A0A367ZTY8_9BACT|nr:MAG: hypothetical protein OZSIB_2689 [Candidatus Ozemobacter sibiricus]
MSIYLELTRRFNTGRFRAILSGGQAVVMHRLAMMSKDGDWILREDDEACQHVLNVLQEYGATYRFGAPLHPRWLVAGWSSHLEFVHTGLRVRTDFLTRPPRLSPERVEAMWARAYSSEIPFLEVVDLIETKKTNREKDYAVIGELARLLVAPEEILLHSRSARDLAAVAKAHPDLVARLLSRRPMLAALADGRWDVLEAALDAERRQLMRAHEARLARFAAAAARWAAIWPEVSREMASLPLAAAHALMIRRAEGVLPVAVPEGEPI